MSIGIDYGSILHSAATALDYGSIANAATVSGDYGSIADIFPDLPGITWKAKRTPMWNTLIQTAASGKEVRAGLWSSPVYKVVLEFEFLRSASTLAEFQTLLGFFHAHRGALIPFYFRDDEDCLATGQLIGYGDGTTTDFQMVRSLGPYSQLEPIQCVEDGAIVYLDAVAVSYGSFSISDIGLLQFATAPAAGQLITADFGYLWKVRFREDEAGFERFLYQLWECKTLELITLK